MERTLVILKPGTLQRGLVGEVISRFEKRGLKLVAMKMKQLDSGILDEHYSHLKERPFFPWLKAGMMAAPVILCCWEGFEAVKTVREMAGATNSRNAAPGTIRGDYGMSSRTSSRLPAPDRFAATYMVPVMLSGMNFHLSPESSGTRISFSIPSSKR